MYSETGEEDLEGVRMGEMLASTLFCAEDMVSCLGDPTAREL